MANNPPTPRQLAYLDELKMRLNDLRERQAAFMAETAKMLDCMSSAGLLDDSEIDVTADAVVVETQRETNCCVRNDEASKGNKIKHLVQRFEDLRKTSEQFSDLPMPQELIGVDVRKLLTGYEKLIEDGSVLQQSWYMLKKSTESCARHTHKDDFPSSITGSTTSQISFSPDLLHSPHGHRQYTINKSNIFRIANRNALANSSEKAKGKETLSNNWSCSKRNYGRADHARWGPLLQLIMCLNPLHRCHKVKSKRNAN